jgi:hypothetical protein
MAAAYSYVTTSGAVKSGPGLLVGAVLSSGAAAGVTLKDGGASGATLVNLRLGGAGTAVFTPAVPVAFSGGLYCTVDSGTVEVTVVYV